MLKCIKPSAGGVLVYYGDDQVELKQQSCMKTIKELCMIHRSTYEGRKHYICRLLHIVQKPPILISDQELMFPVSCHDVEYWWINYHNIHKVKRIQPGLCKVIFKDDSILILHCDYRSVHAQMKRCHLFMKKQKEFSSAQYFKQQAQSHDVAFF